MSADAVTVQLQPELREQLVEFAVGRGLSLRFVVEAALIEYLAARRLPNASALPRRRGRPSSLHTLLRESGIAPLKGRGRPPSRGGAQRSARLPAR